MEQSPFTKEIIESMQACIDHARDLLVAAKSVQDAGKSNIAYHLAALGLEELGRRELIGFQTVANATTSIPPAWLLKHMLDHEQKMFWAFFGAVFRTQKVTKEGIDENRSFAKHIHSQRIAGLYVDTNDGLNVPSEAIPPEETENLIGLVEARLGMASVEDYSVEATREEIDLQNWFLGATDDETKRKLIFSDASMTKLAELGNARKWIEWLKGEFDATQAQAMEIVKRELEKNPKTKTSGTKPKWRVRIRLFSDANSVRPKAVNWWNERVLWIKLVPVPERKREMIVEILLNEDVSLDRLWHAGWMVSRQFLAALNLATRAFWWWHLPRQISRYYERAEDLENGFEVNMERRPMLKVAWGSNLILDEEALRQTMLHMTVITQLVGSEAWTAVEYYLGGLTFLSLNEIHWQCELQAYGNFHQSLKVMMNVYGGWSGAEPFDEAFSRLLSDAAPGMPSEQRERYVAIARAYEGSTPETVSVDLSDVGLIKVVCDTYFASVVAPAVLAELEAKRKSEADEQ